MIADSVSRERSVEEIGTHVTTLSRLRDRHLHAAAAVGGEQAAHRCLLVLARCGPMRARDLAGAVYTDPSTVSRHVSTLVAAGLVERAPDPEDGRASVLVLTAAGRARVEELRHSRNGRFHTITADWTDDELTLFATLLGRFVSSAEEHVSTSPDSTGKDGR